MFLMSLDKKVTLASFQENMPRHKTVFLSLCRRLWEDKLLYTLVPAARLFSRAACLAISQGTSVSKSCSRRVSFWDWGQYDEFSKVVGLVGAFGARVEIIFAHILVFPACAIEVQHINENSPTIHASYKSGRHLELLIYDVIRGKTSAAIFEFRSCWNADHADCRLCRPCRLCRLSVIFFTCTVFIRISAQPRITAHLE